MIPQLRPDNPVQSTPNRFSTLIDQYTRIIIKAHHTPVRSLILFLRAHDDRVPDISSSDFVGGGDGDGASGAGFWAEVALFLDDYYYSVTWEEGGVSRWGGKRGGRRAYRFVRGVSF